MLPSCAGLRTTRLFLVRSRALRTASAQEIEENFYKRLSLEELADIDVTAVARRAEPVSGTAAAVTVLTSEDIRRSGATNIPELFRMIPGMHVARSNTTS